MSDEWLTAQQLAAEWGRPVRWIKDHQASGDIPTVKIGRHRWFTPACRAALEAQIAAKDTPADPFDRP